MNNHITMAVDRLLISALERGADEIAVHALRSGADANARASDGSSALHLAARLGRLRVIDALIASGARRDGIDSRGLKAFDVAVGSGRLMAARKIGAGLK